MLPSQLKHLTGWPIGSRFAEVDRGDEYVVFSFAEMSKGIDVNGGLSIETEIVIEEVIYKDRTMTAVWYASLRRNVEEILGWPDLKFSNPLFNKRLEDAQKCLTSLISSINKDVKKS